MDADQVSGWSVPLKSVVWASRPNESGGRRDTSHNGLERDAPAILSTLRLRQIRSAYPVAQFRLANLQ